MVDEYLKNYEKLIFFFSKDKNKQCILNALLPLIEKTTNLNCENSVFYKVKKDTIRLFYDYRINLNPVSSKKEVVFWPAQKMHLDFMIPVSYELEKASISYTFVTNQAALLAVLKQQNRVVTQYSVSRTFRFKLSRFCTLKKIVAQAGKYSNPFKGTVDLVLSHFHAVESCFSVYQLIKKKLNPKYHLLGYDFSIVGRVVGEEAVKDHIPTGVIQHGTLNYRLMPYSQAKQLFLWDTISYDTIKAKAPASLELIVTGSPNPAHHQQSLGSELFSSDFKSDFFNSYNLTCLITFSGPGHNISESGHQTNISVLASLFPHFSNVCFVIRLHPKDSVHYYHSLLKLPNVRMQANIAEFEDLKISELIKCCDFILTGASTVTFEAFQLGKPVICLDSSNELNHIEFLKSNLIYLTKNFEDLKVSINSIVEKDNEYVKKNVLIYNYKKNQEQMIYRNPALVISKKIIETIYH